MLDDDADRLTLRRLRPDEREALDILAVLRAAEHHPFPHGTPPEDKPRAAARAFASLVEAGSSWIAERDGRPVGVLLTQPIAFVDDAQLTFWVEEIVVVPEQRRRGVATALYRTFGAWARAAGTTGVLTRVDPDDAAALALHRRVGFESHGTGALLWRLGPG